MLYWKIVRRAWLGFIGGTAFGFGYLALVPPFATSAIDTAILLMVVAAGITTGVVADLRISRSRVDAAGGAVETHVRETVSATS